MSGKSVLSGNNGILLFSFIKGSYGTGGSCDNSLSFFTLKYGVRNMVNVLTIGTGIHSLGRALLTYMAFLIFGQIFKVDAFFRMRKIEFI